jgi:predicted nucleic acid-binding protein
MVSVAYFDTRALLKRYVTEAGTEWVNALLSAANLPLTFLSADGRLVGIAKATGLLTDNPHDHA